MTLGISSRALAATRIEEIHGVSIALFLERGYDATPLSAIAGRLGLTKAGLYHHFESKEQLLFDIHRKMLAERLIPVIVRAENDPDPRRRLDHYLRDYVEVMGSDPAIRLLIEESKRLTPEHLAEIEAVWRRGYRVMKRSIEELQESGEAPSDVHASYAAFAAIGMCSWLQYWFDHRRPASLPAVAADFARIFLRGVMGGPLPDESGSAGGEKGLASND